ncbi:MAG: sodium/proline symporter [Acidobacteriota bacterium]|nr:sodium/proline symporter [Acidobacteriota bacterium]
MDTSTVVLVTLIVYKLLLIGIGLLASRKTHGHEDFFLAGRGLGPWVAALSANASTSSAWVLLGISGAAYNWGWSAFWIFPGGVLGYFINWLLVAPRLRVMSRERGSITVTDFLTDREAPLQKAVIATASAVVLFSFTFYVAAQFQGAGKSFQSVFGMSLQGSVLLGAAIIVFYTMVGGFWAVSLTDTLQGAVMFVTAVLLPIGALAAVGGPMDLIDKMNGITAGGFNAWDRNLSLPAMLGFIGGMMGIGIGAPGQPHVLNRFMAMRDEQAVRQGQVIAIGWAVLVYGGMMILGWCARVLYPVAGDGEAILFTAATDLFPPVLGGVMVAAVLSASMSTADSQLLTAASCITNDLMRGKRHKLWQSRLVVLLLSLASALLAIFGSQEIFGRVLFAWSALGAVFGPPLLVTLFWGRVPYRVTLASMIIGFSWVVIAHSTSVKGTMLEAGLPFLFCLGLCRLLTPKEDSRKPA